MSAEACGMPTPNVESLEKTSYFQKDPMNNEIFLNSGQITGLVVGLLGCATAIASLFVNTHGSYNTNSWITLASGGCGMLIGFITYRLSRETVPQDFEMTHYKNIEESWTSSRSGLLSPSGSQSGLLSPSDSSYQPVDPS